MSAILPTPGVWTLRFSQPGGLSDGGRRGVFGGGDLRATAREKSCTPAGVPDSSLSGLLEIDVSAGFFSQPDLPQPQIESVQFVMKILDIPPVGQKGPRRVLRSGQARPRHPYHPPHRRPDRRPPTIPRSGLLQSPRPGPFRLQRLPLRRRLARPSRSSFGTLPGTVKRAPGKHAPSTPSFPGRCITPEMQQNSPQERHCLTAPQDTASSLRQSSVYRRCTSRVSPPPPLSVH